VPTSDFPKHFPCNTCLHLLLLSFPSITDNSTINKPAQIDTGGVAPLLLSPAIRKSIGRQADSISLDGCALSTLHSLNYLPYSPRFPRPHHHKRDNHLIQCRRNRIAAFLFCILFFYAGRLIEYFTFFLVLFYSTLLIAIDRTKPSHPFVVLVSG
jgi:hypothetical protein